MSTNRSREEAFNAITGFPADCASAMTMPKSSFPGKINPLQLFIVFISV